MKYEYVFINIKILLVFVVNYFGISYYIGGLNKCEVRQK